MWQFPEPLALIPKEPDPADGNLPPWDKHHQLRGCAGTSVLLHGHIRGDLKYERALLWGDSSGGTAQLPVGQEVRVSRASPAAPSLPSTLEWHVQVG